MSRIKGTLGNVLIAESSINPGANVTNMRRTLARNPYDPINFIRIQVKIPETLNFAGSELETYDFASEVKKNEVESLSSVLEMQKRHQELISSFSISNYQNAQK